MPKYFVRYVVLIFLTPSLSFSQDIGAIDYTKFVSAVNEASMSAVFIKTPQYCGTGSFFGIPFSDTTSVISVLVATAKHVLFKSDSLGNTIGRYDNAIITLMTIKGEKEERNYKLIYEDDKLDIAILAPTEKLRPFIEYQSYVPYLNGIASFSEIKKGLATFIAGFPFGIGSTSSKMNPVLQSGIVSYFDTLSSLVLIDIPVNPGNSGCPVYIVNTNCVVKLLGLVFQYEPSREDFVFRKSINMPAPANTSLGRVVLLQSIIPTVKKFVRN